METELPLIYLEAESMKHADNAVVSVLPFTTRSAMPTRCYMKSGVFVELRVLEAGKTHALRRGTRRRRVSVYVTPVLL